LLFDRQDREKTLDKNKEIHTRRQGANLGQKQGIRKQPFETMTRRKPWAKTKRFTPGDKEKTLGKNKK
jgi:hypothetical protein